MWCEMPLVSIIVPVYKTEKYIHECVDSLINQTLKDIEIILVDDGSPDNCPAICDAYADKDNRIVVIHKDNGGLSDARNVALKTAKGDYIGFVDSDDFVEPTMFEKLYNSAITHNSDISICSHSLINSSRKDLSLPFKSDVYKDDEIVDNFIIPLLGDDRDADIYYLEGFVCRQLFKRDLIADNKFKSERAFFAEDVVFDLEVYQKCSKMSVVNEPLYCYRYNEESLSNRYRPNVWNMLFNLLSFMDSIIDSLGIQEKSLVRNTNQIIRFIKFSLINLKKEECPLTKKEKINELKTIFESKYAKTVLKTSVLRKQDFKTTILFLLAKLKLYYLILLFL